MQHPRRPFLGAALSALSAYATFAWLSAYEASPIVRGVGVLAAARRFGFNIDLVVLAAVCAIAALGALLPRRPIDDGVRVRATAIALDRGDVMAAIVAVALALVAPMPLVAWSMPAWRAWAGPATGTTMIVATLAALALAVARIARPATATIGSDGVLVERARRRPRFVAYADVASAVRAPRAIDLLLRGGGRLRLHVGDGAQTRVARAVDEATRDGGDVVAGSMTATGDYRTSQVPAERLFRVVEDPAARADVRAGAARALAPILDESGRARIRAAADESAHPELRAALAEVTSPLRRTSE